MQPDIKDQDYMYRLMISQLSYDGHQQLALSLASSIGCSANPPAPCDKLFRLISVAKQCNEAFNPDDMRMPLATINDLPLELIEKIVSHLDVKDVLGLMTANKRLYSNYAMDPSIVFGKHVAEVSLGYRTKSIQKLVNSPSFELNNTFLPVIKRINSCNTLWINFHIDGRAGRWDEPICGMLLGQLKSVNRLFLSVNRREDFLKFFTSFCGTVKKKARLDIRIVSFEQDQALKEQLGKFIENQLNECKRITLSGTSNCFYVYYEAMMKTQIKTFSIKTSPLEFPQIVNWVVKQGIPSRNSDAVFRLYISRYKTVPTGNGFLSRVMEGLERVENSGNHSGLVSRANKLLRKAHGDVCFFDKNSSCFRHQVDSTTSCIYFYDVYDTDIEAFAAQFLAFYMSSQ